MTSRHNTARKGLVPIKPFAVLWLIVAFLVASTVLVACGENTPIDKEGGNETSDNVETFLREASETESPEASEDDIWIESISEEGISVRRPKYSGAVLNATNYRFLANTISKKFASAGYKHEKGYGFRPGNLYSGRDLIYLPETYIIINEDREDLRELANELRSILGVGVIVEENSSPEGWTYEDEFLICIGEDYLVYHNLESSTE